MQLGSRYFHGIGDLNCRLKFGETGPQMASLLDLNRYAVSRVISRYRQCGSVENRPRTGRPPILSCRAKRVLLKDVKKSRNAPLQEITNTFNQSRPRRVSQRTIRRALREEGYQRRVIGRETGLVQRQVAPACNWVVGQSCI